MMVQSYNTLMHPADFGGCGAYRMRFPSLCAQTLRKDIRVIDSSKVFPKPEFYQDIRMVRVQRQVSDFQVQYILNFLKPLSQQIGFWLCYEIDDVIGPDDIPLYNMGRESYQHPTFKNNIKTILNAVDFVTVTTERLKQYYHESFEVPLENIIVIPNYMPRWWIGEAYNLRDIEEKYEEHSKNKFRIGFASSSTHFDINNQNGGIDDFTHIIDFIRDTVDKYQWVFIGGIPTQLHDLAQQRKIEVHRGSDLFNYPRELKDKQLDVVVAPLADNIFNRCKSNIKFAELSALGIPCIVQDLDPYYDYTDLRFKDSNDLQNQLDTVLSNKKKYIKIVKEKRHIIDYGDKNAPNGWWLEKNMAPWFNMFMIAQKTLMFDIRPKDVVQAVESGEQVSFDRG